MKKLALATLIAGLCSTQALAEDIAIVGGYTHTMNGLGAVQNATVLISDGRIESVTSGGEVPAGYRVIDARDKVVTPGLIGAFTQLGLVEVGYSAGTVDASHTLDSYSPLGAALDVSYAINPDSSLIPISRIEGFTSAVSAMSHTNRLFHGQGAVITLGDNANPVIKSKALMVLAVDNDGADDNGGSRAALWPKLDDALATADSLNGDKLGPNDRWYGQFPKEDVNALIPVVQGQMPLVIEAHRASDIRQIIALKDRYSKLDLVLLEGSEAWRVADELADADIPVILNPESNLPYAFDQLGATLANASRLSEAGVTIAIGVETHNIRLATQHAGNAVSYGLPWEEGLAALTINTARIFGVDTDYGSLEAGKVADVVVWSGDPLEVMEAPEHVVINGEEVNLESRQTKLRDRYLNLEQDKPHGYVRP
ncbi:hypothetical protein HMF8227_01214 [Saliniradius amylolyticus]|uniref:Amidohydrolase-related domain-containing protein n=1 Tax=Saliniradius amylolyticus TaxID=2183582 RepID=A0A2S2E217_9ALTE|nr:amidohydrolase family protein [Saliniradius amylolyticus]AWL11695.1 hypothetical protein HMF8227_01214 [Saliniradius amylolyticus]